MTETSAWNTAGQLATPEEIAAYLEAALEEGDDAFFTHALGIFARANGMTKIAVQADVTREALYKALSASGDPRLSTLLGVVKALGLRIVITTAQPELGRQRELASAAERVESDPEFQTVREDGASWERATAGDGLDP